MSRRFIIACLVMGMATAASAHAADLFNGGNWASLAADHVAKRPGDSLTVLIAENSMAKDSAQNVASKGSTFGGTISADASFNHAAALGLNSGFNGSGETTHAHQMLAQITVVVDAVSPNGDLHVSGAEALKINGEKTNIRLSGRVRPDDIMSDNTVISTRLADASIEYDGSGIASAKPGFLSRIISWLGL